MPHPIFNDLGGSLDLAMLGFTEGNGGQAQMGLSPHDSVHEAVAGEKFEAIKLDDAHLLAISSARRMLITQVRSQFAQRVKNIVKSILKWGVPPGEQKWSSYLPAANEAVRKLKYVRGVPLGQACQQLADDVVDLLKASCPTRNLDSKQGGIFYFFNARPMDYLLAFIALAEFCRRINMLQRERLKEEQNAQRDQQPNQLKKGERRLKKASRVPILRERSKMAKEARRRAKELAENGQADDMEETLREMLRERSKMAKKARRRAKQELAAAIQENGQIPSDLGQTDKLTFAQEPLAQPQENLEQEESAALVQGSTSKEEESLLPEGLLLPEFGPLPLTGCQADNVTRATESSLQSSRCQAVAKEEEAGPRTAPRVGSSPGTSD